MIRDFLLELNNLHPQIGFKDSVVEFKVSKTDDVEAMEIPEGTISEARWERSFVDVLCQPAPHIAARSLSSENNSSFWVKKDSEVLDLNLNSLLVVSRLFAHYSWREVKRRVFGKKKKSVTSLYQSILNEKALK